MVVFELLKLLVVVDEGVVVEVEEGVVVSAPVTPSSIWLEEDVVVVFALLVGEGVVSAPVTPSSI